jgi:hypothetical protein
MTRKTGHASSSTLIGQYQLNACKAKNSESYTAHKNEVDKSKVSELPLKSYIDENSQTLNRNNSVNKKLNKVVNDKKQEGVKGNLNQLKCRFE